MQIMIDFSKEMMAAIADFLNTEPIIYLYGMIIFLFVVKTFLMIIDNRRI